MPNLFCGQQASTTKISKNMKNSETTKKQIIAVTIVVAPKTSTFSQMGREFIVEYKDL